MKKNIALLGISLLFAFSGFSQTAVSIANGNWTSPSTWNCTCVPVPGATVTINHTVTLNTSFGYTSGSITINSGGALLDDATGRDIWVNGGGFSNNGNVDVRFLLTSSGSFSNGGILTARAFSNAINFTNSGTFQNLDSMLNNAIIINNGLFVNIDSITNNGTFTNNGISTYNQFTNNGTYTNSNNLTFTDITNNGILTNTDTILGLNSMWNQGSITNNLNALLTLNKSLLNMKISAGTASINNNGRIKILDSYYNYDTIRGIAGGITVQDSSVNYGFMLQTFDFCDATPSPSPNIDYNFGTISGGITYCVNTKIEESKFENVVVFPNPASTQLSINLGGLKDCKIMFYSSNGKLIANNISDVFDISELSPGLYFVSIWHDNEFIIKKVQIIN